MGWRAKVAPESSPSEEIKSSNNNTLLAFENSELSSAITGKVIETNDTSNKNIDYNERTKQKRNHRKRIARSVSEVVEEKEKRERNVCSRMAHQIRRNGYLNGMSNWFVDEIDLFRCRCSSCAKYVFNKVTCSKESDLE